MAARSPAWSGALRRSNGKARRSAECRLRNRSVASSALDMSRARGQTDAHTSTYALNEPLVEPLNEPLATLVDTLDEALVAPLAGLLDPLAGCR